MKRNNFLIGMCALATLTLTACGNEEIPDENTGNGNTEVVEGVDTWAKFSFNLGKDGGGTRATGTEHEGTTEEKSIKKLRAYIFNEAGNFEAKTEETAVDLHNNTHTAVLKLTSGNKKIYVVANMDDSWITAESTTTQFEAIVLEHCTTAGRIAHSKGLFAPIEEVERKGNFDKISGNGNESDNGYLMANVLAATGCILNPGVSQEACSRDSYKDDEEMAANNHIKVSISRATAKLQATYRDDDALILKNADDKTLGKLLSPYFTVRNLPIQSYMFLHNQNGFITPFYTMTNTNSVFADFAKYYDEENIPELTLAISTASGGDIKSTYLPENSNQTPVRGNTTYVLVKGTFAPAANVMINKVEVVDASGSLSIKNTQDATDYTKGETVPAFFMIPEWDNQIYTASEGTEDLAEYGLAMILKTYLNKAKKQKWLNAINPSTAVNEGLGTDLVKVYYISEMSPQDGIYGVASIKKYSESKSGGYIPTEEAKIRFLQYVGGTCYYRVNIEDDTDGKTEANNLFYSVMRNRFYNVNISKITSIGYPSDEDVTIDPSDPINQKTYMQAHITVSPWTEVDQDAELGM